MNLEELQTQAEKDLKIDDTELDRESEFSYTSSLMWFVFIVFEEIDELIYRNFRHNKYNSIAIFYLQ